MSGESHAHLDLNLNLICNGQAVRPHALPVSSTRKRPVLFHVVESSRSDKAYEHLFQCPGITAHLKLSCSVWTCSCSFVRSFVRSASAACMVPNT